MKENPLESCSLSSQLLGGVFGGGAERSACGVLVFQASGYWHIFILVPDLHVMMFGSMHGITIGNPSGARLSRRAESKKCHVNHTNKNEAIMGGVVRRRCWLWEQSVRPISA